MAAHRARRPLIGVTAGVAPMMAGAWAGHDAVVLTEHYVAALRAAGARPVVLAPQEPWSAQEVAELDAIVLTGGTDLDPSGFGEEPLPTDLAPSPERDAFEISLYRAARAAGVPVLGICRGLQVIALAEGGSLHRHLPADLPEHPETGRAVTPVEVEIDPASEIALVLGTRAVVSAYHHQGVASVPASLRVVGRHASGLALALETADQGSPVLAVQWHPELEARERAGEGVLARLVALIAERAEAPAPSPAGLPWSATRGPDEEIR